MRIVVMGFAVAALVLGVAGSHAGARAPGKEVKIAVTEKGFVPPRVKVKAGEPLTLAVTRKTKKTCATEIVLKEFDIMLDLPLNETVRITLTPKESGDLVYACGMDMIKGTIVVQPARR